MGQRLGLDSIGTMTRNSGTQVQLAASKITVGGQQYRNASPLFINTGGTGAGGLDTGALGTNQTWYVHAIVSGGALALVASLSLTAPTGFATFTWTGWAFVTGTGSTILFVSSNLDTHPITVAYNSYSNAGSVDSSTGNTILWSSLEYDPYSLMASGIVTVPLPGLYELVTQVLANEGDATAAVDPRIYKNGSPVRGATMHAPATIGRSLTPRSAFLGRLVAGDNLLVNAIAPFGNMTYAASFYSTFELKRLGP